MRVIIDKVESPPPHALTRDDVWAIIRVVPADWPLYLDWVHLSSALSRNGEWPVTGSAYSRRLTVYCRGMEPSQARRAVLREIALDGLGLGTRRGRNLSKSELSNVDQAIAPLLLRLESGSAAA